MKLCDREITNSQEPQSYTISSTISWSIVFTQDSIYNTVVTQPRIVIDTNVIIAALRSQRGASALLLSRLDEGLFEAHVSVPLVLEYEDVLLRQRDELGLSADDVGDLIDSLCALAVRHEHIYFHWRPILRDERDEHILELAVKGQCSAIMTYNIRDFSGVERFGIRVINPQTFLREIGVIP